MVTTTIIITIIVLSYLQLHCQTADIGPHILPHARHPLLAARTVYLSALHLSRRSHPHLHARTLVRGPERVTVILPRP
eukprot:COSAG01_NODE_42070_length_444_cov_0.405797_2_plen_77_part_01